MPATGPEQQPLRLLLVEDDTDDVLLCRDAIAHSDLDCVLCIAGSLGEAVERLDRDGADVALVDLSLPDAQQLEAVTALAQRFTELPIVVLTGLSDEQAVAGALQAGAEDYLVKGRGSHETIGRAVRYAIERKRGELSRLARDAAEAQNQAKNVFISRMSHELRTPLNAILGFAQLLEADLTGHDRELAAHIVTAGRHLHGLINEILDFAVVEAGEFGLSLQPVHLARTIDEAVILIRPLAADGHVSVQADLANVADVDIVADPQRLSQVLLNLLSNAVKYNTVGGTVTVLCTPQPGQIRVEIRDTGTGLNAEQLANLFTPFNRFDAKDSGVEGTGLGLVITKRLVEAMGATIEFDSAYGIGTTACTTWTVAAAAAPDPPPAPRPDRAAQILPGGCVLYIEDNPVNVALAERILAQQPGVRLISATTAGDGLACAQRHHPDVILLDLNLPDMTGYQVMAALRADPATRATPIIVITADATTATRERVLASGAFAHLTKPIQLNEFLDTAESALRLADPHTGLAQPLQQHRASRDRV